MSIVPLRQRWEGQCFVPRHLHAAPYVALVLAGEYEECGWYGRLCAKPGDVLLHNGFDFHLDRFHVHGAELFNLALDSELSTSFVLGKIDDADAVVRSAESNLTEAKERLLGQLAMGRPVSDLDWPELLARDIRENCEINLAAWARKANMAAETVSRGFARVFGVPPSRFRSEWRARQALLQITGGQSPLSAIAVDSGFSDQPHMSRRILDMTGRTPGQWRRA